MERHKTDDLSKDRTDTRALATSGPDATVGARFAADITDDTTITVGAGGYRLSWEMHEQLNWQTQYRGREFIQPIGRLQTAPQIVTANGVRYDDIYTRTDSELDYILTDHGLKENFVLNQPLPQPTHAGATTLAFGVDISYPAALTPLLAGEQIFFTDGEGIVFEIPEPVAYDAGGNHIDVSYRTSIDRATHSLTLYTHCSARALADAVYPVTIDPMVKSGSYQSEQCGYQVAVGDYTGDGYDELFFSAPYSNRQEDDPDIGIVYVYFGSESGLMPTPQRLYPASPIDNERFGISLAIGQIDSDVRADLAVGAFDETTGEGRVYLFQGTQSEFFNQNPTAVIEGSADAFGFGCSIAIGEFDGSGIRDLAIGAYNTSGDGSVSVFTFTSLKSWSEPNNLSAEESAEGFGYSVAAGDLDNDGVDELVVGAPYNDEQSDGDDGRIYVYKFNSGGGFVVPSDPTREFSNPDSQRSLFGYSLLLADFDQNGYDDLVVGAPGRDDQNLGADTGAAYLYPGVDSIATAAGFPNPRAAFKPTYGNLFFGAALNATDINLDGYPDLMIGAPATHPDATFPGHVASFYGAEAFANFEEYSTYETSADLVFKSAATDDAYGFAIGSGDYQGDGNPDIAIGAPYNETTNSQGQGPHDMQGEVLVFHAPQITEAPESGVDTVFRTGSVLVTFEARDRDTATSTLVPQVQYRRAGSTSWTDAPQPVYGEGDEFSVNIQTQASWATGMYDIRARVRDSEAYRSVDSEAADSGLWTAWSHTADAFEVRNNAPNLAAEGIIVLNQNVYRGENVTVTVTGSDIEDTLSALTCTVRVTNPFGTTEDIPVSYNATEGLFKFTLATNYSSAKGNYQFHAQLTDSDGNATAFVTAANGTFVRNIPPVAKFDDAYVDSSSKDRTPDHITGDPHRFNGAPSFDPEGAPLTNYSWVVRDQDGNRVGNGTGQTFVHSFGSIGPSTVELTVTDVDKSSDTFEQEFQVEANQPPEIDIFNAPDWTEDITGNITFYIQFKDNETVDLIEEVNITIVSANLSVVYSEVYTGARLRSYFDRYAKVFNITVEWDSTEVEDGNYTLSIEISDNNETAVYKKSLIVDNIHKKVIEEKRDIPLIIIAAATAGLLLLFWWIGKRHDEQDLRELKLKPSNMKKDYPFWGWIYLLATGTGMLGFYFLVMNSLLWFIIVMIIGIVVALLLHLLKSKSTLKFIIMNIMIFVYLLLIFLLTGPEDWLLFLILTAAFATVGLIFIVKSFLRINVLWFEMREESSTPTHTTESFNMMKIKRKKGKGKKADLDKDMKKPKKPKMPKGTKPKKSVDWGEFDDRKYKIKQKVLGKLTHRYGLDKKAEIQVITFRKWKKKYTDRMVKFFNKQMKKRQITDMHTKIYSNDTHKQDKVGMLERNGWRVTDVGADRGVQYQYLIYDPAGSAGLSAAALGDVGKDGKPPKGPKAPKAPKKPKMGFGR